MTGQQKYNNLDPKDLDHHLKQNKRIEDSKLFSVLFSLLFVSVGVVGIYISIYPTTKHTGTLRLPLYNDKSVKEVPPPAITPELKITGELETAENLTFTIIPFDKRAEYIIEFGDGSHKTATANEITHQYTQAGMFHTSVTRTKNGISKELFTKGVNIGHPPVRKGDDEDSNE